MLKHTLYFLFPLLTNALSVQQNVDHLLKIIEENEDIASKYIRPERNIEFSNFIVNPQKFEGDYDFVIVGGGSSGAVMASRLSEIRKWNILLIETGGEETEFNQIPNVATKIWLSAMNWGYLTLPQRGSCQAAINNQCDYSRGKVLGGCSSINTMIYSRGSKRDFDLWQRMGNKGWSYEKVLPYFRKAESAHFVGDDGYTGYGGPQSVSYNSYIPLNIERVIQGWNELGLDTIDYNGRRTIGISQTQNSVYRGQRVSSNRGYLQSCQNRSNLKILTRALATKISFSHDKYVKKLIFLYKKQTYYVEPQKELIISGGSINSPQLLMLSGIGPRKHLQSLGIKVQADLPVGQNLEDHIANFYNLILTNHTPPKYTLRQEVQQYLRGSGPLSASGLFAIQYFQVDKSLPPDYPDIEVLYQTPNIVEGLHDVTAKSNNLKQNVSGVGANAIFANILLLHTKSRGQITLKSRDPLDHPLIDPNYFSDPSDIDTLIKGIEMILEPLVKTDAMKNVNASIPIALHPDCKHLSGKDAFGCHLRQTSRGTHAVGTCRMGPSPKDSVVDSNLKVHGLRNLRVVDASVIPLITSGHIHASAQMIAEKISDQIKKSYGELP